jgi:hypothetical protein
MHRLCQGVLKQEVWKLIAAAPAALAFAAAVAAL